MEENCILGFVNEKIKYNNNNNNNNNLYVSKLFGLPVNNNYIYLYYFYKL